jgi:hypothetical protein
VAVFEYHFDDFPSADQQSLILLSFSIKAKIAYYEEKSKDWSCGQAFFRAQKKLLVSCG